MVPVAKPTVVFDLTTPEGCRAKFLWWDAAASKSPLWREDYFHRYVCDWVNAHKGPLVRVTPAAQGYAEDGTVYENDHVEEIAPMEWARSVIEAFRGGGGMAYKHVYAWESERPPANPLKHPVPDIRDYYPSDHPCSRSTA